MTVATNLHINRPKTITGMMGDVARTSANAMYNVTRRRRVIYVDPNGNRLR